jgi:hypothetical protein
MTETRKVPMRKRTIVGWRQVERRKAEIRWKQRTPPDPARARVVA